MTQKIYTLCKHTDSVNIALWDGGLPTEKQEEELHLYLTCGCLAVLSFSLWSTLFMYWRIGRRRDAAAEARATRFGDSKSEERKLVLYTIKEKNNSF